MLLDFERNWVDGYSIRYSKFRVFAQAYSFHVEYKSHSFLFGQELLTDAWEVIFNLDYNQEDVV